MSFGQVVVGPPGSGKSTYCALMQKVLTGLGRHTVAVNLDPANDEMPYDCAVNITDLVSVAGAMEEFGLGPNGALLYCMDYLEKNIDWLISKLKALGPEERYIVMDFPGQVELYVHNGSVRRILNLLRKAGFQLCVVYLVDSQQCVSASNYISGLLTCLMSMMVLEMPQVNVLTKLDLVLRNKSLDYPVSCYEDVTVISQLCESISSSTTKLPSASFVSPRYAALSKSLGQIVEDYSLVAFHGISTKSAPRLRRLLRSIDKACGYIYSKGFANEPDVTAEELDVDDDTFISANTDILKDDQDEEADIEISNDIMEEISRLQKSADH